MASFADQSSNFIMRGENLAVLAAGVLIPKFLGLSWKRAAIAGIAVAVTNIVCYYTFAPPAAYTSGSK